MAFTSESIPEVEKTRLSAIATQLCWSQLGSRWLVDRARELALLCSHYDGRGYEGPPGEFALLWKDVAIPFEAYSYGGPISEKYKDAVGRTAFHVLDESIRIPAGMEQHRPEVIEHIKEALVAEGLRSPLWQHVDVEIIKKKRGQ